MPLRAVRSLQRATFGTILSWVEGVRGERLKVTRPVVAGLSSAVPRRALFGLAGSSILAACTRGPAPSEVGSGSSSGAAPGAGRGRSALVVGAGAAGLAAARELVAAGWQVTVLEARDRLGGRIHTVDTWPGVPIDLGASWIHGTQGNPVTPLARAAGARLLETSYDSADLHVAPRLVEQGLTDTDTDRWDAVVQDALRRAGRRDTDVSLAEALAATPPWSRLDAPERADLAFYLSATYETEWGLDVADLSAWTADGEKSSFDGPDALLPGGYAQVIDHLARGLTIRRQAPVTAVRLTGSGVSVTAGGAELSADAVVVTVPAAVLGAGVIRFEPDLPGPMRRALHRLGTGVLSKTFLRFDRPFWSTEVDWHEYLGPQGGSWTQWVSLARAGAPVLLGFNAGSHGRRIEAAQPAEVTDQALTVLRDMFGARVPAPSAVLTSGWSRDPWARGSYSANAVGSTRQDRLALAAPLEGRVFWAGEATEPDHHSTVHGAVLSGRRAATQLRQLRP